MTRHIESYRYEVQHGHDADFVAYQRKSSDGVWQTISRSEEHTSELQSP